MTSPQPQPSPFLDPAVLLETSLPRPRAGWLGYMIGLYLLVVLLSTYLGSHFPSGKQAVEALSIFAMFGVVATIIVMTRRVMAALRTEKAQVESAEELIQMRRWNEAAWVVGNLLSQPTRSPQSRVQGLVCLAALLNRFHRFDDAVTVYEALLNEISPEGEGAQAIRVARATALLREDRLVDADRAMGELRRRKVTSSQPAASSEDAIERALLISAKTDLTLLELYRDVKTGHPEEALATFEKNKEALRKQLGFRYGRVLALTARAHDLLGHKELAKSMYADATALIPEVELVRLYPELKAMVGQYPPTLPPDARVGGAA